MWKKLNNLRKAVSAKFNAMPFEHREIASLDSSIDCIRDLLMMKEDINKILDRRIKTHREHLEKWHKQEAT